MCVYRGGAVCKAGFGALPGAGKGSLITSISSYFLSRPMSMAGCTVVCNKIRGGVKPTNMIVTVVHRSLVARSILPKAPAVLACGARTSTGSLCGAPPTCKVCVYNGIFG